MATPAGSYTLVAIKNEPIIKRINWILPFLLIFLGCFENPNPGISTELPLSNFLWLGIDQPLEVNSSSRLNIDSIEVIGGQESGLARKQPDGTYMIVPKRKGSIKVILYSRGTEIDTCRLNVKSLAPYFRASLCSTYAGKVGKKELLNCNAVRVEALNSGIDLNMIAHEFSLVLLDGRNYRSTSGQLTDIQKEAIEVLHSGDQIYFEDILIEYAGEELTVPILKIEIK